MDPPASIPRDREIMKYAPPVRTRWSVAMAVMERAVRKVMEVERVTMRKVPGSPTFPTTHPNLRYMMTPRMVRMEGVKTPPKVPRPPGFPGATLARCGEESLGLWSVTRGHLHGKPKGRDGVKLPRLGRGIKIGSILQIGG